jgi:hypothetical protein
MQTDAGAATALAPAIWSAPAATAAACAARWLATLTEAVRGAGGKAGSKKQSVTDGDLDGCIEAGLWEAARAAVAR